MWSLAESVNGSNAVAPFDEYVPKTAASLEDMYRETSPRPLGFVRGACEGGVIRGALQGGQATQSQLRVSEQH